MLDELINSGTLSSLKERKYSMELEQQLLASLAKIDRLWEEYHKQTGDEKANTYEKILLEHKELYEKNLSIDDPYFKISEAKKTLKLGLYQVNPSDAYELKKLKQQALSLKKTQGYQGKYFHQNIDELVESIDDALESAEQKANRQNQSIIKVIDSYQNASDKCNNSAEKLQKVSDEISACEKSIASLEKLKHTVFSSIYSKDQANHKTFTRVSECLSRLQSLENVFHSQFDFINKHFNSYETLLHISEKHQIFSPIQKDLKFICSTFSEIASLHHEAELIWWKGMNDFHKGTIDKETYDAQNTAAQEKKALANEKFKTIAGDIKSFYQVQTAVENITNFFDDNLEGQFYSQNTPKQYMKPKTSDFSKRLVKMVKLKEVVLLDLEELKEETSKIILDEENLSNIDEESISDIDEKDKITKEVKKLNTLLGKLKQTKLNLIYLRNIFAHNHNLNSNILAAYKKSLHIAFSKLKLCGINYLSIKNNQIHYMTMESGLIDIYHDMKDFYKVTKGKISKQQQKLLALITKKIQTLYPDEFSENHSFDHLYKQTDTEMKLEECKKKIYVAEIDYQRNPTQENQIKITALQNKLKELKKKFNQERKTLKSRAKNLVAKLYNLNNKENPKSLKDTQKKTQRKISHSSQKTKQMHWGKFGNRHGRHNSVAYEDHSSKKSITKQQTSFTSSAHALETLDPLQKAVQSLYDDFADFFKAQIETEKQAILKTKELAKTTAHKGVQFAKTISHKTGNAVTSSLKLTKNGLVLTSKGLNLALKSGIYMMPKVASGASKGLAGYGFVHEAFKIVVVFEKSGGDYYKTGKHAGITGAVMFFTSETPYMAGLSGPSYVSGLSRAILGGLRFSLPAMMVYGAYKLGSSERAIHIDIPNWAGEHQKITDSLYIPYASEASAYLGTKFVQAFDLLAEPISNKAIELKLVEGYSPLETLPFTKQIDEWKICAKRMQGILGKKSWYKNRILSAYKNNPEIQKTLHQTFETFWQNLFFPLHTISGHFIYKDFFGEMTSHEMSYNEKTHLYKGNEIFVSPFEIALPNGESKTLYKLFMQAQWYKKDKFGNLLQHHYIATEQQLDYLYRLKEFQLIGVPASAVKKIISLNDSQPNLQSYAEDKLIHLLYLTGINPKILDPKWDKKNYKTSNKEVFLRRQKDLLKYIKTYKQFKQQDIVSEQSLLKQLSLHKAEWLKEKELVVIRLGKTSALTGPTPLHFTSPYALIKDQPNLKNVLYLKSYNYQDPTSYLTRDKSGHIISKLSEKTYTRYILVDSHGEEVFEGDIEKIQDFMNSQTDMTLVKKIEKKDDQLLKQRYTLIEPYYGIVKEQISYKQLLDNVESLDRLLIVNKVKSKAGDLLFSLTHYVTKIPLMMADSPENLYRLFSSSKIRGKYVLAKPYSKGDTDDFQTNIQLIRSKAKQGMKELYIADSREALDKHGDVFTLEAHSQDLYTLRFPSGRTVFEKVRLKKIQDYFKNKSSDAMIVFGAKDKSEKNMTWLKMQSLLAGHKVNNKQYALLQQDLQFHQQKLSDEIQKTSRIFLQKATAIRNYFVN